jgi:NAD(P)-dependent dehydrogenase (short-subunit alcohol dehydrogenase family)
MAGLTDDPGVVHRHSYRISKAALNQATRTAALEWRRQGTWAVALHPGTCDTDLSAPFQRRVAPEKLFPVRRPPSLPSPLRVEAQSRGRRVSLHRQL